MAISCYVAGVASPIPVGRFDNGCKLLLKAGMPIDDLHSMRSNELADRFEIPHPPLRDHDALDDAMSVALVLRHLLKIEALAPADFG